MNSEELPSARVREVTSSEPWKVLCKLTILAPGVPSYRECLVISTLCESTTATASSYPCQPLIVSVSSSGFPACICASISPAEEGFLVAFW
jgi:hypothetical protein